MSRLCRQCNKPINPDRLAVLPDTTLCIGCAMDKTPKPKQENARRERHRRWRELQEAEDDSKAEDPYEAELEAQEKEDSEDDEPAELLAHEWYGWATVRDQALTLAIKQIPTTPDGHIDWLPIAEHCERYKMLDDLRSLEGNELLFELLYRGWLRPTMRRIIEEELLDGQTQEDFESGAELECVPIDSEWQGSESDGESLEQALSRSEVDADGRWQGQWSRAVLEDACLELARGDAEQAKEIYNVVTVQEYAKELEGNSGKTQLQAMAQERGISYDALRKRRERYIKELKAIIGSDPRKYAGTLVCRAI
jgi:hypothetical protein